jgi:hypothetical protein
MSVTGETNHNLIIRNVNAVYIIFEYSGQTNKNNVNFIITNIQHKIMKPRIRHNK